MKVNWKRLISLVLVCEAAGLIGTPFTTSAISSWYVFLNKPVFNPPAWLFGPVWTVLYALMGLSLYLVWEKGIKAKKVLLAVKVFFVQLILNALWSIIFFGLKNISLALIEIVIFWFVLLLTVLKFYRIDKKAGYLLLPYLAWVSFASFLTYNIWLLNR